MSQPRVPRKVKPLIGWREWVALPALGIDAVKVKVDTGARTSSLHAYDIEEFRRRGKDFVRFKVHPDQRSTKRTIEAVAPLLEWRKVRPSSGHEQLRPVILTTVELMGSAWEVELTLTGRDAMGFRMLLGRQAIRGHYAVDPGASYLGGRRTDRGTGPRPPRTH